MHVRDAKAILGLAPDATLSQVKTAYKKKALECHPDRLPAAHKLDAQKRFQQITEAYTCLNKAWRFGTFYPPAAAHSVAVTPPGLIKKGSKSYYALAALPFVALIFCTLSLGAYRAKRAYQKQKKDSSPDHPFLP